MELRVSGKLGEYWSRALTGPGTPEGGDKKMEDPHSPSRGGRIHSARTRNEPREN